MKIGIGFDVHKLVEGRKLILGGVEIESEVGLEGHSDADVLCHAISDALLGAAKLGDIGRHFPDTNPAFKDAYSLHMLSDIGNLVHEKGYVIRDIDSVIVCQAPKLAPYREAMFTNIARALRLRPDQVGVKATTTEGLGPEGKGQSISAQAVCLIESEL